MTADHSPEASPFGKPLTVGSWAKEIQRQLDMANPEELNRFVLPTQEDVWWTAVDQWSGLDPAALPSEVADEFGGEDNLTEFVSRLEAARDEREQYAIVAELADNPRQQAGLFVLVLKEEPGVE